MMMMMMMHPHGRRHEAGHQEGGQRGHDTPAAIARYRFVFPRPGCRTPIAATAQHHLDVFGGFGDSATGMIK